MDISYDRYSLIINGKREFIRSGAMHYFRLPSQELWRDRLYKLKAAGYNTVDLYFCWNYHSPEPGVYDFTGIRDVGELLRLTQELGLYVIARPGPYINAEYSGGGFPGWLLAKKHLPLRNRREGAFEWSDEYMGYVREWWEQITPFIKAAPNVLMMQIENEYATLEAEPDYMRALYDMSRELGITVPLFHNDLFVAGLYEDIVDLYAFDNYSVTQFETDWRQMPEVFQVLDNIENNLRPFCQERPLFAAELQAGWFGGWKGYKYDTITEYLGREHINISTKTLLGQGLTLFNHYKAIGGTNWDYTGSIETYTSYDFGAPISEAGINTERLFESKALNTFIKSFEPYLVATERSERFPLSISDSLCLYAVRHPVDRPEAHWLFLRNLGPSPQELTVGEQYPVTMNPFEAIILPYRIPLDCGYELTFATTEALYQNGHTLVLKGSRPVMVTLSTDEATPTFTVERNTPDIELLGSAQGEITFQCATLPEHEWRRVQIGSLTVLFLGQCLIDTFWVQEDGTLVFGPDMRLPGEYGFSKLHRQAHVLTKAGKTIQSFDAPSLRQPEIPALGPWQIFDEAPELTEASVRSFFKPIEAAPDFDTNAIYEGAAWYRVPLDGNRPSVMQVDARHIWATFLNGECLGTGQQLMLIHGLEAPAPSKLSIPPRLWNADGENELLVFVSGLGHPKGFHDDAQTPQGLLSLTLDHQDCTAATQILPGFYSHRPTQAELNGRLQTFERSPIVRARASFTLPETPDTYVPWGIRLQDLDFERINLYLNGELVGRYWRDCQRQDVFYLPPGILKTEPGTENVLELILMNFEPYIEKPRLNIQPHQVQLHPYSVFTRWSLPAKLKI